MAKLYIDKIRMNSGMSLMISDLPAEITLTQVSINKPKLAVVNLGFFESATPNFHTYYPEIKNAADIKPNDGDYIKPVFRLLSEVVVRKNTNPVDFSMNGVLKKSMNKMLGQTVYANHEALVGNEIGVVSALAWQDSYKTDTGIIIPAGMNGEFKIDSKSHPNIVRNILSEPPAIHSNSVTVEFGWAASHPKMDVNEFRSKLGTKVDGELVRRIVEEVRNFHETSLVAHGADPYAQLLKGQEITNPDYADQVYSLSAQGKSYAHTYFFNYRDDIINLSKDTTLNNDNHNQPEDMKDLIAKLMKLTGKSEAELTEDFIEQFFKDNLTVGATLTTTQTELAAEKVNVTNITTELTTEKGKVTSLTAEVIKLKADAVVITTKLKADTKKAYELLKGDKKDEAMLSMIEKANDSELEVFLKQYNTELEEKFPAKCNACGSGNVSRNTASPDAGNTGDSAKLNKTNDEVMDDIRKENKGKFIFTPAKKD